MPEAGGSGLDRVVKVTVFHSDWKYFRDMHEAYAEFFGTEHPPPLSRPGNPRARRKP